MDYFDPDPSKREAVTEELRVLYPHGFVSGDADSEGSDGNPEEDCIDQDLNELEKAMKKRKIALKKLAQRARRDRKEAKRHGGGSRRASLRDKLNNVPRAALTATAAIRICLLYTSPSPRDRG